MLKLIFFSVLVIFHVECASFVSWNTNFVGFPSGAVVGGYIDDTSYYIIRAQYGSELLFGRYNAQSRKAYVSSNGNQIRVYNFEVSCLF
jgi:hypothetical protein